MTRRSRCFLCSCSYGTGTTLVRTGLLPAHLLCAALRGILCPAERSDMLAAFSLRRRHRFRKRLAGAWPPSKSSKPTRRQPSMLSRLKPRPPRRRGAAGSMFDGSITTGDQCPRILPALAHHTLGTISSCQPMRSDPGGCCSFRHMQSTHRPRRYACYLVNNDFVRGCVRPRRVIPCISSL